MFIIPAIDLKQGRCVRLRQGDMAQETVFSGDPAEIAVQWAQKGASRIHIVDLDGATAAKPQNTSTIKSIIAALSKQDNPPKIQLGGGIRELSTIEQYLEIGIDTIVLGSAAITIPGFLQEAVALFGQDIFLGLDAKQGKVAVDGWTKVTKQGVFEWAKKAEEYGVGAIIYTDIARDGMLSGVNIDATVELAKYVSVPIIASGGVHNVSDVEALLEHHADGIEGVICGRSIYEGTLDFEDALKLVRKKISLNPDAD